MVGIEKNGRRSEKRFLVAIADHKLAPELSPLRRTCLVSTYLPSKAVLSIRIAPNECVSGPKRQRGAMPFSVSTLLGQ